MGTRRPVRGLWSGLWENRPAAAGDRARARRAGLPGGRVDAGHRRSVRCRPRARSTDSAGTHSPSGLRCWSCRWRAGWVVALVRAGPWPGRRGLGWVRCVGGRGTGPSRGRRGRRWIRSAGAGAAAPSGALSARGVVGPSTGRVRCGRLVVAGLLACGRRRALPLGRRGTRPCGRGQAFGRLLYAASVALFVEAFWNTSSHGPVLTSNSLPKPTHLPVMRRPVGSTSSWIAPW